MKPIVDGLEETYSDQIAFLRLDADNEGRAAFRAWALRGHPSYVIIDTHGAVLWKAVGQQPRSALEAEIEEAVR